MHSPPAHRAEILFKVPSKDFPALFPSQKHGVKAIMEVSSGVQASMCDVLHHELQGMSRGKDLTHMLRSVNAHHQQQQQQQQQQDLRSPKRPESSANQNLSTTKSSPEATAADTAADENGNGGKGSDDGRGAACLPVAALRLGCYVCGKEDVDNGDIFVAMNNEGKA
jgi:hypothetical protein